MSYKNKIPFVFQKSNSRYCMNLLVPHSWKVFCHAQYRLPRHCPPGDVAFPLRGNAPRLARCARPSSRAVRGIGGVSADTMAATRAKRPSRAVPWEPERA